MHPQTYLLTLLTAITTLCHAQAVPGHYDQFLDRNPIDHNPNGLNTTGLHPCIVRFLALSPPTTPTHTLPTPTSRQNSI